RRDLDAHATAGRGRTGSRAREVLREAEVQGPVESDPHLLLQTRQLAQIDRTPEPPGEEPREPDPEDVCDPRPTADGGELSERREPEGPGCTAEDARCDVARDGPALAERMLGRGWVEAPGSPIGHQRAVAERPHTGPAGNREILVHRDPAVA